MPTSVQYPLERQRDVERKWKRLLERTVAPKDCATAYRKVLSSAATAQLSTLPFQEEETLS